MHYTLALMNGREYEITEEERQSILGKTGFIHLPRLDVSLNIASVSVIEPKGLGKPVDRTKQLEGVTPQGEVVIKRFGRWYYRDVNAYQVDEDGQSILEYHGEQLLPTPAEYESEFKHIAPEAWTSKLIGRSSEVDPRLLLDRSNRTTQGGFQPIYHNHLSGGQP